MDAFNSTPVWQLYNLPQPTQAPQMGEIGGSDESKPTLAQSQQGGSLSQSISDLNNFFSGNGSSTPSSVTASLAKTLFSAIGL